MSCDCNTGGWAGSNCSNPCSVSAGNTAACESLPSQISNFTAQFFGEVVKTEIDGEVTWTLPCNLEVGLPANPRLDDEGLACYFLRLFMDGIIGLTGPQGDPGTDGLPGRNAYTVTLLTFSQPTLLSPTVQVKTLYNPAMLAGVAVFIATSGWYSVDVVDISGNLWLTLIQPVVGVSGGDPITAGKLVVPTGPAGAAIVGPIGPAGPTGPVGPTGGTYTGTHGQTIGVGADDAIQVAFTQVTFGILDPAVLLPAAGVYLLTATIQVYQTTTTAPPDALSFMLWDANAAAQVPGSLVSIQYLVTDQWTTVTISALHTCTGPNHTIQLYSKTGGSAGDAFVAASSVDGDTIVNYVRLS